MFLEELPHHRARFEVSDTVHGPTTGAALRVLWPAMTHSSYRAERHLGAGCASLVRDALGRAHVVVGFDGRTGAAVDLGPAVDVRLGARVTHGRIRGSVNIEDGERARRLAVSDSAGNTADRGENIGGLAS